MKPRGWADLSPQFASQNSETTLPLAMGEKRTSFSSWWSWLIFFSNSSMMADLNLSAELMKNYRAKTDPSEDMDLTVSVLSNANWPSYPALAEGWESFQLPQPVGAPLSTASKISS